VALRREAARDRTGRPLVDARDEPVADGRAAPRSCRDVQLAVAVRDRDGHARGGEGVLLDVRIVAAGRVPDGEVDADRRAVAREILELAAQRVRAGRERLREGDRGAGDGTGDRRAVEGGAEDI